MPDCQKDHYFFWYGAYYATQAMYQIGAQEPELWAAWYRASCARTSSPARCGGRPGSGGEPEGWWLSNVDQTNAYATASALLILQFPLDQLPIHQR